MKQQFITLALTAGWAYAVASFRDQVSVTQLELWTLEFKSNGGY